MGIGSKNFGKKKSEKLFQDVKCHPRVIGASNATRGYRGVKCHPGVLVLNATPIYWGVKGQGHQRAQKPHGVNNQGRQRALYG